MRNSYNKMKLEPSMKNRADINEVINLLHDFNPAAIRDLTSAFPAYRKLIEGGVLLGEGENEVGELEVRAEICKAGLEYIRKKSDEIDRKSVV